VAVLYDTTVLHPAERPESWSEAHERIFFPIGVRFVLDDASRGRIQGRQLGQIAAYRVASDPSVVRRTAAAIRSLDPEQLLVATQLRGSTVIEQEDRMSVFGPGDLSTWDSSHPFRATHAEPFDLLLLALPWTLLGPRRDVICRQTAGRIAHGSVTGRFAASFFRQVWGLLDGEGSTARQEDIADGVTAVVRALCFPQAPDNASTRQLRGYALLPSIKAYIDRNLGDPSLGPEAIAQAHYISTRYLHKLFALDEVTVSDWVRHRRLEACRRDLRDPALAHETISDIGRRWGLSNPAHFSRVFRAAYGCTASDLRRSAIT
jgi:AraC-like DNA-binding protein